MKVAEVVAVPLTRQPISNKVIEQTKIGLAAYWLYNLPKKRIEQDEDRKLTRSELGGQGGGICPRTPYVLCCSVPAHMIN